MAVQIQLRNDLEANWTSANPVLATGELGAESDTDKYKLGDGATAWNSLAYSSGPAGPQGPTGADSTVPGPTGGFDSTQVIETKSADYTLTSADAGKLILNSALITITVEGLGIGQQVDFMQYTADTIIFAAGVGITLNSKAGNLQTAVQYGPAIVKCVATDTYVLAGDLGA
jgi:hypothetical protein